VKLKLGQIADWIHAEGEFDTNADAVGYSIDSRTIAAGELFFAVKGDRVDGHGYVEAALNDGAVAAVVSMRWLKPALVDETKLMRVPDEGPGCVLQSMQRLANQVRRKWGRRVIGVTGSAGKTTTKECIAQVLSAKFNVLKTEGNLNNHFGVPLTLLRLDPVHEVAVLEMGMNHAGEIRTLAKIAEPDWAVVSNVAEVHLEHFADGLQGIARAKYELVESLPKNGIAVLNADDKYVLDFGRGMGDRAILYGTSSLASVRAVDIQDLGLEGSRFVVENHGSRQAIHLSLIGRHNILNALAAIATGLQCGMDLSVCCAAAEKMAPNEKRGEVILWRGAKVINDCYNSNPLALNSMIVMLGGVEAKRRIVVAGEMLELGPEGAALHAQCGEAAADAGIDLVLGVRGLAKELVDAARRKGVRSEFMATPELAGEWLETNLRDGDVVLLKASRGVQLERALTVLQAEQS
jgi:UDP-N-acetylmuramoyl-tripeptide--D-alanyl-D-alanine ligase